MWWLLPYINLKQPWVYICPTILNSVLPPLHSIPLGCPRVPVLSAQLYASNLHWSSVLHIVIYIFQCYSLISSDLCLLPLCPKVCSLYLCLFWCLAYRVIATMFLKMALKHVKYHVWNELPVQVWCTILDAWGWCTGTTQRDGMGREEGGGFGMGNTCIPVVDSFWYLAKLIQLCKV